ncbi:hypothetical protein KI387_000848, partial [Taxus chinensis]
CHGYDMKLYMEERLHRGPKKGGSEGSEQTRAPRKVLGCPGVLWYEEICALVSEKYQNLILS